MNETPPSFWKRPWRGPGRTFAWYGLATLGAFVALFVIGLLTQDTFGAPELLGLAFVGSILLAAFMFVAVLFFHWIACWQNLRRLLFAVVLLITLIALAYAEENWRGKHAWQTYRQQREAKGEKLSLAELLPPPVPDDQNFALAPLLKPVMDFSHTANGLVWHDTNGVARLQAMAADLQPTRSTNKDLTLGSFEKDTFADLPAWARFYRGNTNYPQADPAAPPADVVLVALSKFAPDLKDLADAAAARPLSRFPIQYSHEPNWGILLPHLARMKGLSTLLSVHATASLAAGRSADAFNDLQLGLRFSDSIRNEPILIDHLVRIAVLYIDLQTLREGLLRHAWSDAQLSQLQAQLASIDILAEYQLAMRGERACSLEAVDFLRRAALFLFVDNANPVDARGSRLAPSGWFYQNMLTIARLDEQFSLRSIDPQARRVYPEIALADWRAVSDVRGVTYDLIHLSNAGIKLMTSTITAAVLGP